MKAQRPYSLGGFTLIELLVVLAIVAVLTAAVAPGFVRLGAFAHNDTERAARDLANLLTAARMYAGTFHTPAAVVYIHQLSDQPASDTTVAGANSFALARRLTEDEAAKNNVTSAQDKRTSFVLCGEGDGNWHRMTGDTYVPPEIFQNPGDNAILAVKLYRTDEDGNLERITPIPDSATTELFPAHIFSETGMLLNDSTAGKARFTMTVRPSPEAPEQERTYTDANGTTQPVEETIDIYATMGRVQIVER